MTGIDLIDVTVRNVSELGFFCFMSKRKSDGYQRKLNWLTRRFSEGMRIKMLGSGARGFIEYIPGEYAWRAVNARGYMFIHCLWVVGKSKGKGYAGRLLDACIADAKKSKTKGVAVITSKKNWLAGNGLFYKYGFESVGQAPPSFELMVKQFAKGSMPSFPNDWDKRISRFAKGLTIIRSDQCPYLQNATNIAVETANEMGIQNQVIEMENCRDVKNKSPSAYGVFNLVNNGKLLGYHYLTKKELQKRLKEA